MEKIKDCEHIYFLGIMLGGLGWGEPKKLRALLFWL